MINRFYFSILVIGTLSILVIGILILTILVNDKYDYSVTEDFGGYTIIEKDTVHDILFFYYITVEKDLDKKRIKVDREIYDSYKKGDICQVSRERLYKDEKCIEINYYIR